MRMKSRRSLAILLCMVLLLALAPSGFAVNLEPGANTLTVNLAPTDKSEYEEDLAKANIQVDLYKLASAKAHETDDSYVYELPADTSPFYATVEALNKNLDDAEKLEDQNNRDTVFEKFEPYAQAFARIVLDPKYKGPDPKTQSTVDSHTAITVTGLDAGLYLLIIRGSDLTTKDNDPETGYVVQTELASSGDAEAETVLATRVVTDDYKYLYRPQLLTVPTKLDGTAPQYNTAYGEWTNELIIYAKPTREANNGDLKIIKNVNNPGPDPVTFVFEVSWKDKSNNDVVKVVSMTFQGETRKAYDLLNGVPIGTEVTVTEVHSGIGYTAVTGPQTVTIQATPPAEKDSEPVIPNVVEFTNDHTGPGGGHGLLNRFTAGSDSNSFTGAQYDDSADADQASRKAS